MKANLQGRLGDLCRMPSWLRRLRGQNCQKDLILQEKKKKRVPWSSEYHTSKGNRIKVAFKASVKEAGDITHGPHTYQHENVTSVPPAFV